VGNRDRTAQVSTGAIERCLAPGIDRRPLATAHGIDEHDSGNLVGVEKRELAQDHAAKGMSDQHVGRMDACAFEHAMKLACSVRGRALGARRAAPSQAAAIVPHGAGESRHFLLDRAPVEMSGGDSGLENYSDVSGPFFDHEEILPISDFDPSAGLGVTQAIAPHGNDLIRAAKND
jgi:hypothetical protein